jgi:hypothetical protein
MPTVAVSAFSMVAAAPAATKTTADAATPADLFASILNAMPVPGQASAVPSQPQGTGPAGSQTTPCFDALFPLTVTLGDATEVATASFGLPVIEAADATPDDASAPAITAEAAPKSVVVPMPPAEWEALGQEAVSPVLGSPADVLNFQGLTTPAQPDGDSGDVPLGAKLPAAAITCEVLAVAQSAQAVSDPAAEPVPTGQSPIHAQGDGATTQGHAASGDKDRDAGSDSPAPDTTATDDARAALAALWAQCPSGPAPAAGSQPKADAQEAAPIFGSNGRSNSVWPATLSGGQRALSRAASATQPIADSGASAEPADSFTIEPAHVDVDAAAAQTAFGSALSQEVAEHPADATRVSVGASLDGVAVVAVSRGTSAEKDTAAATPSEDGAEGEFSQQPGKTDVHAPAPAATSRVSTVSEQDATDQVRRAVGGSVGAATRKDFPLPERRTKATLETTTGLAEAFAPAAGRAGDVGPGELTAKHAAAPVLRAVLEAIPNPIWATSIEIQPEGCGRVQIRLSPIGYGSEATWRLDIRTADPTVHALLLSNLDELRQSVGTSHVTVQALPQESARTGDAMANGGRGEQDGFGQDQRRPAHYEGRQGRRERFIVPDEEFEGGTQ